MRHTSGTCLPLATGYITRSLRIAMRHTVETDLASLEPLACICGHKNITISTNMYITDNIRCRAIRQLVQTRLVCQLTFTPIRGLSHQLRG